MLRSAQIAVVAAMACLTGAAGPATPSIALSPPGSQLHYTVYALGAVPMRASFGQFSGSLDIDPQAPGACTVQVTVQVASLHMADQIRSRLALSAGLLDAADFPVMHFTGQCRGALLVGLLTLHGVTRPLTMTIRRDGAHVIAQGSILRRDFGIRGLAGLVGQIVRFQLDADLPQAVGPNGAPPRSPGRGA